jgi:Outer membrane protein V
MKRSRIFSSFDVSQTVAPAILTVVMLTSTSHAQSIGETGRDLQVSAPKPTASAQDWNVTLGGGVGMAPIYPGASRYEAKPLPLVSISYRNTIFLTSDGLRVDLINANGFRFGPLLGYFEGRNESDDPHLRGLGNIQPSATAGVFGAYRYGPFEMSVNIRQAITHSDNGLLGTVRFDYRTPLFAGGRAQVVFGPNFDFADASYEKTWFGVSSSQAANSGLTSYNPKAGLRDVGLHADISYRYSEHILVHGLASVQRLTSDAGDSPVVQDRTQALVGMGIAYHF